MQSGKPEKILGKKFVRGKPYYKIKWEGSGKDQSTWETPASLKNFKSMINKYEIKNWGSPLDDKFFDISLYNVKAVSYKQKKPEKRQVKDAKKAEKRKIEEPTSQSEEIEADSSVDGLEFHPTKSKVNNEIKEKIHSSDSLQGQENKQQIIDLDIDDKKSNHKKQDEVKTSKDPVPQQQQRKIGSSSIDIQDLIEGRPQKTNQQASQYQRDLGLVLQNVSEAETHLQIQQPMRKRNNNLGLINAVSIGVQGVKRIKQIVHIYHLQKMSIGNHLYLVEFEDKVMNKMTSRDLITEHPQDFVCFLEKRFRAKDF